MDVLPTLISNLPHAPANVTQEFTQVRSPAVPTFMQSPTFCTPNLRNVACACEEKTAKHLAVFKLMKETWLPAILLLTG